MKLVDNNSRILVNDTKMTLIWKNWCRLCAQDDDSKIDVSDNTRGDNFLVKITKYLSIQVEMHRELPDAICRDCYSTLAKFDLYATRCTKVQSMFQNLLQSLELYQDDERYRTIRNEYLLNIDIDEDKFIPICSLKTEDDKKVDLVSIKLDSENSVTTRKRRLINRADKKTKNSSPVTVPPSDVKDEVVSDNDDRGPSDNTSDDDYLPLATVTDTKIILKARKRKSTKKIKHSSKAKRKKGNKTKSRIDVLDALDIDDMNIKMEPMSDDNTNDLLEPTDNDLKNNLEEKAAKKERKEQKKNATTCLKYECYICGEDCRNWHALCVHFRDVHDTRAKVMCCCGKFLASRVSIGRHCAKHGKSDSHNCPKCNKRFPRESELASHMITHLPKEEYPFVCCKCARRFTTQQLLRHHEKKHIPMEERMVHPCEICKSKFASKSSLLMHMKAVHERLKPFVCDQCGRAFTTKGILEEHQVRHSDARPHVCSVCHKSFKTKQRLAIHSDTHNDTVYQCPHCPIQLNSRRTLRMHLFVHDEVCRYQCSFCEKAFKRAKDLKNHSNLHTGRRPYSCPWCTRTFANGSNCRAHKRRMHPTELRISDASAAMVNKVIAPPEDENAEKKPLDPSAPKIIYTTVKRKLQATPTVKMPHFQYPLDVTEKEQNNKIDEKNSILKDNPAASNLDGALEMHVQPIQNNTMQDLSQTKQEKTSPLHIYESSMSPLNLNTSAPSKYVRAAHSNLTILPAGTLGDETIPGFQDVGNNFHQVQHPHLQNRNIQQNYSSADYKDVQDEVFSKGSQQLYSNFTGNNVPNLYSRPPVTSPTGPPFSTSNPYGLHYNREDNN